MRNFCQRARGPQDCLETHIIYSRCRSACGAAHIKWCGFAQGRRQSLGECGQRVCDIADIMLGRANANNCPEHSVCPNRTSVCAQHYRRWQLSASRHLHLFVEDTNTLPCAHAQSSAESPTQSEASLIRQGLNQFMMFNRDLLFLHIARRCLEVNIRCPLHCLPFDEFAWFVLCCLVFAKAARHFLRPHYHR
jgi:hypothetical protein